MYIASGIVACVLGVIGTNYLIEREKNKERISFGDNLVVLPVNNKKRTNEKALAKEFLVKGEMKLPKAIIIARSICGDEICDGYEDTTNCHLDCGTQCGDDVCNGNEDTVKCPDDCGSKCGDGVCNGDENPTNCPEDCGSSCGDGVCNGSESAINCPADCSSLCGDGVCNREENTTNCPKDCGND